MRGLSERESPFSGSFALDFCQQIAEKGVKGNVEYDFQCKQFADFDVQTVGLDLGIVALGGVDAHELQFGDHLVLRQQLAAGVLNGVSDVHIGSDFLHVFPSVEKIFRDKEIFI